VKSQISDDWERKYMQKEKRWTGRRGIKPKLDVIDLGWMWKFGLLLFSALCGGGLPLAQQ